MPHALSMPAPGFQAVILCGPGVSFDTFTSKPEESPKALIPIANRPMVWYPLDFCYRMGITNITLIAPPASASAISSALNTNPHLTSLTAPKLKPTLLAPAGLDQTTGTAHIFRLPEVRSAIVGDFIVLPCDLVCELGGEALLQAWMIKEASLGGVTGSRDEYNGTNISVVREKGCRRGGLGVWYETKGELSIKGEETDFIATAAISLGPVPPPRGSLLPQLSNLVYSLPTDTLNDITGEKKSLPLRHSLIRRHGKIRMLSTHRDAHLYIFPVWVMDLINSNEHMDNLSEDVIGWWAKAGWQNGLVAKLGLSATFAKSQGSDANDSLGASGLMNEDIDIGSLSTTWATSSQTQSLGSDLMLGGHKDPEASESSKANSSLVMPPILAYIHSSQPSSPLIRRVDTAPLLLLISLHLAKLDSIEQVGREAASPFAHPSKVAYQTGIATKSTITRNDCLLAENVTVEERCAIKECVIGANCQIQQGAKLTRCILMDGVIVGKGCKLTGSILGRRAEVGSDSILQDCEVEDNMRIEAKSELSPCCDPLFEEAMLIPSASVAEAKNEKFKSSEGLEATEEEMLDAFDSGHESPLLDEARVE